ncbi:MAG TPA: alpha/beta fold hydrolase [Ktedonobacterales bacterium]|nr:alpha/beta fold hydrolase [Ktedonobacterales bacterium]
MTTPTPPHTYHIDHSDEAGHAPSHPTHQGAYCLLVHGFNGEPAEMRELANVLRAEGMKPRRLLLPGHGTNIYDFAAHGWDDWFAAVRRATTEALGRYEWVFLIGHSLGAALSLAVASVEPEVAGVVALCPPVRLHGPTQRLVERLRGVVPAIPTWTEDVHDRQGARSLYRRNVYPWTPLSAVHSLFTALPNLRGMLPDVRCPALIVRAQRDHVVPARDGLEAYELIGSTQKKLITLERSFHAVTKDVEREIVFAETVTFCHEVMVGAHADHQRSHHGQQRHPHQQQASLTES